MKPLPLLLLALIACQPTGKQQKTGSFDPLAYVDPFIGTGEHGHTVPGAARPFGMVQLSPDTHIMGWDASSGYHYDDPQIYGFSHTHLSGTGIGDLGDVLVLPFTGEAHDSLQATFDKASEKAAPGRYEVAFTNFDVKTELTATTRVGIHRYTFTEGSEPKVMLDLGHILQPNWGHRMVISELEVVDDHTIRGSRVTSGWAFDQPVYFYATFSQPFTLLSATDEGKEVKLWQNVVTGKGIKVFLAFEQPELLLKVGISPVDLEGAKKNLEAEAADWDFGAYVQAAQKEWQEKLSAIEIQTEDEAVLKNFYTALYHTMFAPMVYQDVDGRYRGMDKRIHQAKDGYVNYTVFSLWDTFRAQHPLMTLIEEEKSGQWMASLLRMYEEGGVLPKWPLWSNYTGTMVGYPAASVLADAVSKDIGGFDPQLALEAAIFSSQYHPEVAERNPEPRVQEVMPPHLQYLNERDFIPGDSVAGSVSYGLECAYYDWCIARIAEKVGDDSLKYVYDQRAQAYRKYFDPETGFMRGKLSSGEWKTPFSPYYSDHELGDYVEGNAWQWSWFVPHDAAGLIELHGGKESFVTKLDSLYTTSSKVEGERASADISGLIGQYAHGNEPSHHIAYFYHRAGQPEKAWQRLDEILYGLYSPTPAGISGNEDCGQMSAWYVLNAIGLYQPCPGDPVYAIGRPIVDEAVVKLGNGKELRIVVENNSRENKVVESASWNGEALQGWFVPHAALREGGELKIVMSGF